MWRLWCLARQVTSDQTFANSVGDNPLAGYSFSQFAKLLCMPEQRRTVFISCGQFTEEERELGDKVRALVDDSTPFQGYFAQNQISLKALSENVLSRLYESVGLIVIMHYRGTVQTLDHKLTRASVWIEQEIAIAALMEQVLHRPLHVALFIQRGIEIEGIRKQLHLNPIEFTRGEEVIARLHQILPDWKGPRYMDDAELRELVDSEVSVKADHGYQHEFSIHVKNHSRVDLEIKRIVLWSNDKRLCDPVHPPPNARWTVGAGANVPIHFTTNENVPWRLAAIYGKATGVIVVSGYNLDNYFAADVTVELQCQIGGITMPKKETSCVNVNLQAGQVNGA